MRFDTKSAALIRAVLVGSLSFLVVVVVCLTGASARIYIDIDSPGFQQFPLAIADFRQWGGDPDTVNLSLWLPAETGRYLEMTDYFQIKDRRAFLDTSNSADPFRVEFPDWTTIGVEYLVKGIFTRRGSTLTVEIRVFDTIKATEVFRKTYDVREDEKSGLVKKMAGDILYSLTGTTALFDTRIAFTQKTAHGADVYAVNFDRSSIVKLTTEYALVVSPQWSSDGRYLSYTSYRTGTPAVYIKDLKQKITRMVTPYPGINLGGPWSPDGRKMLLTLSKDGNEEIYSLEIATGTLTRLTRHFAIDVSPSWSPDGKQIVFVSNRSGTPQIYVMDAEGGTARRISYDGSYNTSPAWSPRGDRIAYESRTSRGFQIHTISPQGEGLQAVTFGMNGIHEKPAWSPDGRYLAAVARKGGRHRIIVISAAGGHERVLFETDRKCHGLSWSR
ncbi:MAG: PD40 domain-containing protein [Syntrophaceae bacterium]|nr:PD40 domain-containing protein [Syntrophaceae bacterium]